MSAATPSRTALDGTVAGIMQTDVTTVGPGTTVRELTRILADQGITGVPVVDAGGDILGVVSTSDVTRLAAEEPHVSPARLTWDRRPVAVALDEEDPYDEGVPLGDFFLPEEAAVPAWGDEPGDGPFDEVTVDDIMTPVPFTVEPNVTVSELANFLLRGRIHRAVVTEERSLVGIVTTMDILRAVTATD